MGNQLYLVRCMTGRRRAADVKTESRYCVDVSGRGLILGMGPVV